MAAILFSLAILQDRDDEGEAPVKTCKFQTDPLPNSSVAICCSGISPMSPMTKDLSNQSGLVIEL